MHTRQSQDVDNNNNDNNNNNNNNRKSLSYPKQRNYLAVVCLLLFLLLRFGCWLLL
jgi:hypothetical protein